MEDRGIASSRERIKILRGIYYGTPWSLDYHVERSATRILGFRAFTGSPRLPIDPVPLLGADLFKALQSSQDVVDGDRLLDFGHLAIALDARGAPLAHVPIPAFGGTGVEIVTWLGDLGAAAAWLALARGIDPSTPVATSFQGTDCGGAINLEGDVGGYVVARGDAVAPVPPVVPPGAGIAEVLDDYLAPGRRSAEWHQRGTTFAAMLGAAFDPSGVLLNRQRLVTTIARKIQTFGWHYLALRLRDKKTTPGRLWAAADHVVPAVAEVAETFLATVEDCHRTGQPLVARRFPATGAPIRGWSRAIVTVLLRANRADDLIGRLVRRVLAVAIEATNRASA